MLIDYSYAPREYPPPITADDGLITKMGGAYRVEPEEILVVTGDRNTEGKKDYTGAFRPEAYNFCKLHGIDRSEIVKIDVSKPMVKRGHELLGWVEEYSPKVLVLFCHGYSTGLQFGVRSPVKVQRKRGWYRPTAANKEIFERLCKVMSAHHNPSVVLYACSTGDDPDEDDDTAPGSGDDSFADLMRDRLCQLDARTCRVFAHTTAAHTTRNPHVKLYDGNYSKDGGAGAGYLARPGTKSFRTLAKMLKTDFRFRVPFMTTSRINQLIGNLS